MQVLEKVAKALSRNYGIKVRFQGTRAYTDYKSITLPMLPKDLEEADEIKVRGYCDHEISHLLNSDPEVTEMGFKAGAKINNMRNLLEDFRIERDIASEYIGTRVNMERTAQYLQREGEQQLNGEAPHIMTKLWIEGRRQVCGYELDCPSYVDDLKAAFGDDVFDRMKAMGSGKPHAIDALNLAKQMVKDFEDKKEQQKQEQRQQEDQDGDDNQDQQAQGESGDQADENQQGDQAGSDQENNRTGNSGDDDLDDSDDGCSGSSGGDDELPDTDSHHQDDDLGGSSDEDDNEGESNDENNNEGQESGSDSVDEGDTDSDQGQKPEAGGSGETNEEDGGEADDSDGDDTGEGSGRPDGEAGDQQDSETAHGEADSRKLNIEDINSEDLDDDVADWDDSMNKLQAEIERISSDAIADGEPMPFSTEYDKIKFVRDDATMHRYNTLKKKLGPLNMLKAKLVKLFLTSQVSRWVFDKEEGKINTRKLAGIKAGNRSVFKEKQVSQKVDTAVTLLCDFSGSMGEHGVSNVMAATILFLEALKTAKLETEVLGFTTTGTEIPGVPSGEAICNLNGKWARTEKLMTYIVKEFSEPFNAKVKRRISGAPEYSRVPRRNNSDADSILVAYERLRKQPQRRKVMIVLSDGSPNAKGNNALKEKHLKQVVKDLEKAGVEMIGIGMGVDVSDYYPKNIEIDGTEGIAKTMYGELKKLLKY